MRTFVLPSKERLFKILHQINAPANLKEHVYSSLEERSGQEVIPFGMALDLVHVFFTLPSPAENNDALFRKYCFVLIDALFGENQEFSTEVKMDLRISFPDL